MSARRARFARHCLLIVGVFFRARLRATRARRANIRLCQEIKSRSGRRKKGKVPAKSGRSNMVKVRVAMLVFHMTLGWFENLCLSVCLLDVLVSGGHFVMRCVRHCQTCHKLACGHTHEGMECASVMCRALRLVCCYSWRAVCVCVRVEVWWWGYGRAAVCARYWRARHHDKLSHG